ncbi:MAG: flagellar protein FlgN [Pseudomonadota bacterium]
MSATSPNATLPDELRLMGQMLAMLQQEQAVLVKADTEALNALTPLKSALVAQLGQCAATRQRLLREAGFAAADDGMQAWIKAGPGAGSAGQWQQLLELTRQAKELNRVNGMLINKQFTYNQTILNAMRAPSAGGESHFYGPSGQATVTPQPRRPVIG